MRVTQTMLANSNMNYINQNYNRYSKIMDQINTGKKITRPSDDPVIAMKGMRYRTEVVEVEQFQRNLNEGFNWMENSDAALEETGQVLQRIRELAVQASNDSYGEDEKKNIAKEIERLQEHIVALANTKIGDNYIFNGTDTTNPPINLSEIDMDTNKFIADLNAIPPVDPEGYVIGYKGQSYVYDSDFGSFIVKPIVNYKNPDYDPTNPASEEFLTSPSESITIDAATGKIDYMKLETFNDRDGEKREMRQELTDINNLVLSKKTAVSANTQDVKIEIMKGVTIPINTKSSNAFSVELFSGLESVKKLLNDPAAKGAEITKAIDLIGGFLNDIVSTRAELGAQVNRMEMVENRLLQQEVIANKTMSENEDIDFERVIIDLKTQESLHRASLATGAKIIQPTLMDFLR